MSWDSAHLLAEAAVSGMESSTDFGLPAARFFLPQISFYYMGTFPSPLISPAQIIFSRNSEQSKGESRSHDPTPVLKLGPLPPPGPIKAAAAAALNLGPLNAAVVVRRSAWHRDGGLLRLRGSWPVEENRKMSV